jgi:hypothetical protein
MQFYVSAAILENFCVYNSERGPARRRGRLGGGGGGGGGVVARGRRRGG